MYLQAIEGKGVRNLADFSIEFDQRLNIIYGKNGAGKSSLLEAISLITSGRSFRTSKLNIVTGNELNKFILFAKTSTNVKLGLQHENSEKKNRIRINGENITSLSKLASIYPTQVICPESYHLIDSGPSERRKFIDWILFHVEHSYLNAWKKYTQILKQRNALLRSCQGKVTTELLSWDTQFLEAANEVNSQRAKMCSMLVESLESVLNKLEVNIFDDIKISYYAGFTDTIEDKIVATRESDAFKGFTQYGPHKADIKIKLGSLLAKDKLSRGQKKLLINALFLAQTQLLKEKTNKESLFLIDDFTSELDSDNQRVLLQALMAQENTQIILTSLQLDSLKWLEKGYNRPHMFHVEHGDIKQINELSFS
ncbi:DNA replication/repair protein RecF [Aliikangiella sp. G2MR2-5]|uniref:DNA replication/repair protein RecF n=1 Tax=Aliikangiella sp. G2MR2-5 TaxID=2788943 RepID=UPI0018ABF30B|nr:DNA replication/repair protein RecF [Aliikangiella sp. G2MR2-5]